MKTTIGILLLVGLVTPEVVPAQSTTYVSNLGQTSGGSMAVASDAWIAESFYTGTHLGGYNLNAVQLLTASASGNPSGFSVSIYAGNANNFRYPGSSLGSLSGPDPGAGGTFTYTTSGISLLPSTFYFVVLTAATPFANGNYSWSLANSSSYNSSGGWLMGPYFDSSADGLLWNRIGDYFQFAVNATAVPEPSSLVLFCSGSLFLAIRLFRKAKS